MRFAKEGKTVIRRMRTKGVAQGTYKAFQQLNDYLNRIKRGYQTEVITFERKNLVPRWDRDYDLATTLYSTEKVSTAQWAVLLFALSGYAFYCLSTLWYDQDIQYYGYVTYPKQMRYWEGIRDRIMRTRRFVLSKLPFGGEIPDITQPENYNKFKRELRNYLFNTEEKQRIKEETKIQLKQEAKEYEKAAEDFSKYLEDQTRRINRIKITDEETNK